MADSSSLIVRLPFYLLNAVSGSIPRWLPLNALHHTKIKQSLSQVFSSTNMSAAHWHCYPMITSHLAYAYGSLHRSMITYASAPARLQHSLPEHLDPNRACAATPPALCHDPP
jgi:hypothetical protein